MRLGHRIGDERNGWDSDPNDGRLLTNCWLFFSPAIRSLCKPTIFFVKVTRTKVQDSSESRHALLSENITVRLSVAPAKAL